MLPKFGRVLGGLPTILELSKEMLTIFNPSNFMIEMWQVNIERRNGY